LNCAVLNAHVSYIEKSFPPGCAPCPDHVGASVPNRSILPFLSLAPVIACCLAGIGCGAGDRPQPSNEIAQTASGDAPTPARRAGSASQNVPTVVTTSPAEGRSAATAAQHPTPPGQPSSPRGERPLSQPGPRRPPDGDAKERTERQAGDERVERLWPTHGRNFAFVDGKFVRLPELKPVPIAGVILADPKVGSVGAAGTCKVLKVKGSDDVIVAGSHTAMSGAVGGLPGQSQLRYTKKQSVPVRLKGFPTAGVVDGREWNGPEGRGISLAIIGTCEVSLVGGSTRTVFLGIPAKQAEDGLTKEQFRQLLRQETDLGPERPLLAARLSGVTTGQEKPGGAEREELAEREAIRRDCGRLAADLAAARQSRMSDAQWTAVERRLRPQVDGLYQRVVGLTDRAAKARLVGAVHHLGRMVARSSPAARRDPAGYSESSGLFEKALAAAREADEELRADLDRAAPGAGQAPGVTGGEPAPPGQRSSEDIARAEREAGAMLLFAKSLMDDGKSSDRARERLVEIVKKYPQTKAAAEAKRLLEGNE
jgi:hypothetical protein